MGYSIHKNTCLRTLLVLFFAGCCGHSLFSQKWAWLTGGGARYDQVIYGITTDTVGNIYATGYVSDTLIIQGTTLLQGNDGMFLAKFNAQGQLQYLKGFGSGSNTKGLEIIYDKKGYLYISGTYTDGSISFGSLTLTTTPNYTTRAFLAKTDLNGNGIWAVNVNEGAIAHASILKYNAGDSTLAVAGHFEGTSKFYAGTDTITGRGDHDIFVSAFNSITGARKWVDAGGTIRHDAVSGLDFDPHGNLYMTMTIQQINTVDSFKSKRMKIPAINAYDGVLVKFNKKGDVIWKNVVNGPRDQTVRSLKYGKDGRLYMTTNCAFAFTANVFGISYRPGSGMETSLIKMDTSGKVLKKKDVETTGNFASEMCQDNAGNLYLTGYENFIIDNVIAGSKLNKDFYIVKMDTALTGLKAVSGGTSQTLGNLDLDVSPDGVCVLGGSTDLFANVIFPVAKFKYVSKGNWELFLCKWSFTDTCPVPKPVLRYTKVNKTLSFRDSGKVHTDERTWLFGDGQKDTSRSPVHTYALPGVYIIKLIGESQCGKDSAADTLYLDCIAKAKFGYAVTGRKVQFHDSSSTYLSRKWYFGDGQTDTSKQPLHQYVNNGNYSVKLVVKGVCRDDSVVTVVNINCNLPSSGFTYADTNRNVRFTNISSLATKRTWHFGDGQKDTSANPYHTYALTGNYKVKLVSENVCGKDSITKSINIFCPKPQIDFSYTASGDTISFSAYTTSLAVGSWKYEFGDGDFASLKQVKHYYKSKGIYTVRLFAGNQCGNDTATHTIDLSCILNARFSYLITGNKVQFLDSSLNAQSRLWHFGDGTTDTSRNPVHTYADTGNYKVRLVSANACAKDSTETIIRNDCNKPKSIFTISKNELQASFVNTSARAAKQLWRFGDGGTDTSRQPVHTYFKKGFYTVTLVSENACGSDSVSQQVQVDCKSPIIDFTYSTQNKKAVFNGSYQDATVNKWLWDFGDGNTDTASKPEHTYLKDSSYLVRLIGFHPCSNDTVSKTVLIKTVGLGEYKACEALLYYKESSRGIIIENVDCGGSAVHWQLYSISGQLVLEIDMAAGEDHIMIDARFLPNGLYLMKGTNGSSMQWVSKVMVY